MQIIGIRKANFTIEDKHIEGYHLFITDKIDPSLGSGFSCERVFINKDKFISFGVSVNDVIEIQYNKYGKVSNIVKLSK